MKALITGSRGFVGRHLSKELSLHGYSVSGIDLVEDEQTACVDLLDRQSVRQHIQETQPDALFHLAAQAAIPLSWAEPQKTFEINVISAINLLEAVQAEKNSCRIVMVGSADQYGKTDSSGYISESDALCPQNLYAVSKKAQEDIACVYAKAYSMNICMTRSFNHCGPGQKPCFLIPDLCQGIIQVEQGKSTHLSVGNLEAVRDFTDVRDVVRAYRLINEKGQQGEIYNVGSGDGRKVKDVVDMLLSMASCEIDVRQDSKRMRPSDTPMFVCNNEKIRTHTGWKPEIPFERTLRETLEWYRRFLL